MEQTSLTETTEVSFETLLERIRQAVTLLESGQLSLEQSIATYREGAELIEQSRKMIADAELRISELTDAAEE